MIGYEQDYHRLRHANYSDERYFAARAALAAKRYLPDVPTGAPVLEYGCGLGQNIAVLKNAVGYDVSQFAVSQCLSRGIRATTELASLPDAGFDFVLAAHVLEHHPHPLNMLGEIKRKLRPGGRLVVALPHERHHKPDLSPDLDQHLYGWTFRTINNLLMFAGFRVVRNKYLFGTGYRKLLPVRSHGAGLYEFATTVAGILTNTRELLVVAELP